MSHKKPNISQQQAADLRQYVQNLRPGILGNLIYCLIPYRKKIVLENLNLVFAEVLTPDEIKTIAKAFYRHIGLSILEILRGYFLPKKFISNDIELRNEKIVFDAIDRNEQIVLLTGHFGNWEIAAARASHRMQFRKKYYIIRKKLKNRFIQKFLYDKAQASGISIITTDNMRRKLVEVLKEKAGLVFVMDQRAGIPDRKGIPVEFFGTKVGTYHGMAKIVKKTNATVIPFSSYRKANGQHVAQYHPALPWLKGDDGEDEIYKNTRQYNEILENIVLSHPDQWLWTHKRWRDTVA